VVLQLNQSCYRELIAGRRQGFMQKLILLFLQVMSFFYWTAVALRNLLYDYGWLKAKSVSVPVISIGNITAGGTGKTPLVIWLANKITRNSKPETENCTCAILTRGYKTAPTGLADEPAILARACSGAKVVVNPDRLAGAAKAVDQHDAKVLIMDDGFQHRRLARQLDIVTIDATCPFGYNKLLPAGLLREPTSALKRADAVVITRSDLTAAIKLEQLQRKLQMLNPEITIAKSIHKPLCARMLKDKQISLDELAGKKIYAFCGIGNPSAFFDTLTSLGLKVIGSKTCNDHHHYTEADITDIFEESRYLNADFVLTTQKDWVKTALLATQNIKIPFAYLAVKLDFIEGEDKIVQLINKALANSKQI